MGTDKLDVVRKLLAKADRAATPEEAQTYTAKAVELMARHGIDAALVDAAEPGRDAIGSRQIPMDDPYSAGKARLLAWTASALRCRAILHEAVRFGSGGGKVAAVTLFGFASDRERVELLYTSLLLQAGTQLLRQRPARRGESVAAYRRSWLHGFAVEVHRRLVDAESSAAAERPAPQDAGRSVALVLADRTDRVDRAYAEAFPTVGRARRSTLSGSGFGAGAAAGERADLGRDSVGSGRQRAVGA